MRPMTKSLRLTTFALAAALLASSAQAAAADYYLKFGNLKSMPGNAKIREAAARAGTGQQVKVESWSWGISQTSSGRMIDGAAAVDGAVPSGGARLPVGDFDGDGRADRSVHSPRDSASRQASGKRMHKPLARGSVSLAGKFPACAVGAAYKDALLQVAGARYRLEDVVITSCAANPGGGTEPTLSLSLNYTKIKHD